MAPEQAASEPLGVDASADIFALGVILYELIAGVLPLTRGDLERAAERGLMEALREDRPEPTTKFASLDEQTRRTKSGLRGLTEDELGRTLGGRVRHLPMKAMRLDRSKRFTSAAAMARDIENFLEGNDYVEAAEEPRRERVVRWVRRHRVGVGAATAVAASLVVGLVVSIAFWRREAAAERRATQEANAAVATLDFLVGTLEAASPDEQGPGATVFEVLSRGEGDIDARFTRPEARYAVHHAYGRVYRKLGKHREAERQFREAEQLIGALRSDDPRRFELLCDLAVIEADLGDNSASDLYLARIAEVRNNARPGAVPALVDALAVAASAGDLHDRGDYAAAEQEYARAMSIAQKASASDGLLAGIALGHGRVLVDHGLLGPAETVLADAERWRRAEAERSPRKETQALAGAIEYRGYLEQAKGDWERAAASYRDAIAMYGRVHAESNEPAQMVLARSELAGLLQDASTIGAPLPREEGEDRVDEKKLGGLQFVLSMQLRNRARILWRLGHVPEAEELFKRSVEVARSLNRKIHEAHTLRVWADHLAAAGRSSEAIALYQQALALQVDDAGKRRPEAAVTLEGLAVALRAAGRSPDAAKAMDEAAALRTATKQAASP